MSYCPDRSWSTCICCCLQKRCLLTRTDWCTSEASLLWNSHITKIVMPHVVKRVVAVPTKMRWRLNAESEIAPRRCEAWWSSLLALVSPRCFKPCLNQRLAFVLFSHWLFRISLRSMTFLGNARDHPLRKIHLSSITADPAYSYIISSWFFLDDVECSKQLSRVFSMIIDLSGQFSLESRLILCTGSFSFSCRFLIGFYRFVARNRTSHCWEYVWY